MANELSTGTRNLDRNSREPIQPNFSDSTRYWEPRRLVYNGILFVVVLGWLVLTWPHFRPAMTLPNLGRMLVLGLLANLCYCAAYVVDVPLQYSPVRESWRHLRAGLWVAGTVFAFLLANYWIADEIYPYVD